MGVTIVSGSYLLTKCGLNVNNSISGAAYTDTFISEAESFVNNVTRYNWTDKFPTLNDDVKNTLREAISNLAAIYMINYDISGFTSRSEAETMINVLKARADECIAVLLDKKVETFMEGA
jgi:hypothetical protein